MLPGVLSKRRAGRAAERTSPEVAALRRNGLPEPRVPGRSWPERVLKSRWTWITLAVFALEAFCLWRLYLMVGPDQRVPGGVMYGLSGALPQAAGKAVLTVIPLSLIFLLADRYRPQRLWIWLLTFGWGACVATYVSMIVNTAAAQHLSIIGDGDPATSARAATFVAPFVEESAKATILFFLAIALRNRWVSQLSGIALAGLSAAGFAFVENILYYGRAVRAASRTSGLDPDAVLQDLFLQRGVLTFFGHPLFSCMVGIGLALAMRTRSKLVRVLAPLTGFLAAALLHMLFNGMASMNLPSPAQLIPLLLVGYPLVISLIFHAIRQSREQRDLIVERLGDYERAGWIEPGDAAAAASFRTRVRVLWQGLWLGRGWSTLRMQRALTELAYLRDGITRGLTDVGGLVREKELLALIRALRERAVVTPLPKTSYPWQRRRPRTPAPVWSPPSHPGPAGIGGNYPVPVNSGNAPGSELPLGSSNARYSPVDPRWKPPGE